MAYVIPVQLLWSSFAGPLEQAAFVRHQPGRLPGRAARAVRAIWPARAGASSCSFLHLAPNENKYRTNGGPKRPTPEENVGWRATAFTARMATTASSTPRDRT